MNKLKIAARICAGLVNTNPAHPRNAKILELISRFTCQLPQTLGGFFMAHACNAFGILGGVAAVEFAHGATIIKTKKARWGGIAQGCFIIGDGSIEAIATNALFQHEFGHYLQSQKMGFAYYSRIGIPSILSRDQHVFHPVEQDAQSRAFLYFSSKELGFYAANANEDAGWHWVTNPINPGGNQRGIFWDAQNPEHALTLKKAWLKPLWYDYASWLALPLGGPVWAGLYNAKTRKRKAPKS